MMFSWLSIDFMVTFTDKIQCKKKFLRLFGKSLYVGHESAHLIIKCPVDIERILKANFSSLKAIEIDK